MEVLENAYHNFPRLAQQSGFNFQLYRGRVNWSEIESLDINEIIERRNFELLEQNLANVTNCNLEREYDFKILDQNFVKLFKLAQLGVDYLSYCEMYLDKCVVLLQEQLVASQDECELLKKEIQKRKEVNRSKSKHKALNYQCEKCSKVFISDVYLKFHEKRRHSSTNTPESFDGSPRKCSCNCQKSEDNTKLSTSTQTLFPNVMTTSTEEKEEGSNIKMEHLLKVEKLEHELQDLKERFNKAESTLSEKTEPSKANAFHSINVPMMLLPSYVTHHGYCGINSGCQIPVPEVCQPSSTLQCSENPDTVKSKPLAENPDTVKSKPLAENPDTVKSKPLAENPDTVKSKPLVENSEKIESIILAEKKCEVFTEQNEQKTSSNTPEIIENIQKYPSEQAEELECEKENIDPKKTHLTNLTKPLPPPRKLKKVIRQHSESEVTSKIDANVEEKNEGLSKQMIVRSTPVKEKLEEETNLEIFEGSIGNISEINKSKANSFESLQSKKSILGSESKSFFKKIITRDSSIQKLSRNFRKSLNSLCDSISSTEKEAVKKETNFQSIRTAVVDGLNNHLQHLGISSEWSGIPRKTLGQKLSAWKHQRRLLSKENPLYPVIRKNIEEKVFQKLKKNFKRKKTTSTNSLNKQELDNSIGSEIQNVEDQFEFVKNTNCHMYATDTDSESTVSDSVNFYEKELNAQKTVIVEEITSSEERIDTKNDKESNILLFQAGGSNLVEENNQKPVLVNKRNKLFIDSDTESSFLENFEQKNFKKCLGNDKDNVKENYEDEKPQFKLSDRGKRENQSILKDGEGFQIKPTTNTQKKVLFAMYSKSLEEELSDDPTDYDLWSLKSDWEKNTG